MLIEGGGWWTKGEGGADSLETEIVAVELATKIVDEYMKKKEGEGEGGILEGDYGNA